jgi:hypothetical protein
MFSHLDLNLLMLVDRENENNTLLNKQGELCFQKQQKLDSP